MVKNIPLPPSPTKPDYKRFAAPKLPRTAVSGPGLPPGSEPAVGVPSTATPNPRLPASATPSAKTPRGAKIAAPEMIAPPIHGGNQRVSPKSMKGLALLGRNDNVKSKSAFKRGAHARIDPNGGSTKAKKKK
jgi:hypothetical protein